MHAVLRLCLAGLTVQVAKGGTLGFWRLDGAGEKVDTRNLAATNGALVVFGAGVEPSFRKPLAEVPEWATFPAETRGGRRNAGSLTVGGAGRGERGFLSAPGLGRSLGPDGCFTVEGWLRPSGSLASGEEWALAGAGAVRFGWLLSLRRDGEALRFVLSAERGAGAPAWERAFEAAGLAGDGRWTHVALTYESGRGRPGVWRLFLNGKPAGELAAADRSAAPFGSGDFWLGGWPGGAHDFAGQLDLWRVCDEALPAERLLCRAAPQTLAEWPLGIAAGGSLALEDRSGRGATLRAGGGVGCVEDPGLPELARAGSAQAGCASLAGGIGVRSVLIAPGLGARCDLTNSFTVEGWLWRNGEPGERAWQVAGTRDASNGWALSLRPRQGRLLYQLTASNVSTGGKLQIEAYFANADVTDDRGWQHVALVYDCHRHGAGVWELYLDGVSRGLVENPTAPAGSQGAPDLLLGGRASFSNSFEGRMCRWRISDGVLAPEQLLCQPPDAGPAPRPQPAPDAREVSRGFPIPAEAYCDQPAVSVLNDGSWLCVLTTGSGGEGERGQHVISTVSRDRGRTWSTPVDIEPASGPEASWASCLATPFGRVYAFYTFNGDDVTTLPGQAARIKSAWHGWYAFRYTDDGGLSWSKERTRIPLRVTDVDRRNPWGGAQCHFWGTGRPAVSEGTAYLAITKLGAWFASEGEGWIVASDNMLTERNAGRLRFRLLPEGEAGIRNPAFGPVQEEHNLVSLGGRELLCAYRTESGPAQSVSRDGGKTWSLPERMTYGPGGRPIKSNRACPKLFRTSEGRYLLLYHNHGVPGWGNRNPVFVAGGVRTEGGAVRWSEPEVLLYDRNPAGEISYPDLIEQDGRFWVAETQKSVARVHAVSRALVEGLWMQPPAGYVSREGLAASYAASAGGPRACDCPAVFGDVNAGGLAVELWLTIDNVTAREILFSTFDGRRGVRVVTAGTVRDPTVQVELYDGERQSVWSADPGLLQNDRQHHVVFVCDTRACLVSAIVDGVFCDGGEKRAFGWGRLPAALGHMSGAARARFSSSVTRARLYGRPLATSEAVGNFRAGPGAN